MPTSPQRRALMRRILFPSNVVFDPEAGLTLTSSFAQTATLAASSFSKTQSAVFACDVTIPSTPSGVIFELGAAGQAAIVGFRTDNSFIARMGDGGGEPTTGGTDLAVVYLASSDPDIPSGTGTLVWEFDVATGILRVWWKGVLIGSDTASSWSGLWAGSDDGCYDPTAVGSNTIGDDGIPSGSTDPGLGGTSGNLRYYENQTVST